MEIWMFHFLLSLRVLVRGARSNSDISKVLECAPSTCAYAVCVYALKFASPIGHCKTLDATSANLWQRHQQCWFLGRSQPSKLCGLELWSRPRISLGLALSKNEHYFNHVTKVPWIPRHKKGVSKQNISRSLTYFSTSSSHWIPAARMISLMLEKS